MSFPNNELQAVAWEHAKRITSDGSSVNALLDNYVESLKKVSKYSQEKYPTPEPEVKFF